jgi:hypothetical protein
MTSHQQPGGPVSPAGLARVAAEAIRSLNHVTRAAAGGLGAAVDAYDTLGELALLTGRLLQLLAQLRSFLEAEVENGRMVVVAGEFAGDPPAAVLACGHWLDAAITAAGQLSGDLDRARDAIVWAAAAAAADTDTDATTGPVTD